MGERLDEMRADVQSSGITFEQLPPEVLALFEPTEARQASSPRWPQGEEPEDPTIDKPYQEGPMPHFEPNKSEICTDPEWRLYWERQGTLEAICNTPQLHADVLRRLRAAVEPGHGALDECTRLKPLIVRLYNEKVSLLRSLESITQERDKLKAQVEDLSAQLRAIANEIQQSFPAQDRRGLSPTGDWTLEQWESLYPHLPKSVQRIVAELAKCNADLKGSDGIDTEIQTLKARLIELNPAIADLKGKLGDANKRLAEARGVIAALVQQAAAMGFSMKQINDAFGSEQFNERGIRAFIEGVHRYEFAPAEADSAPDDGTADAIIGNIEEIRSRMDNLRQRDGVAHHPFPNQDEWYSLD